MSQCQKVGGGYEGGLKGRNREKYCNYNSISKLSETYAVFKYINKIRVWHPCTDILTFYLNEFMEEHVQQLRFLQCLFCVVDYARVAVFKVAH